jgi:hypothetical protein
LDLILTFRKMHRARGHGTKLLRPVNDGQLSLGFFSWPQGQKREVDQGQKGLLRVDG